MPSKRYTKYAEHCVNVLEEQAQYPSDQHLVQLMQLQLIADEISQTLPHDQMDGAMASPTPMSFVIKTLQTKLNIFRNKLPSYLQNNRK